MHFTARVLCWTFTLIFLFEFHAQEFRCNTVSRPFYMNNPVFLTFHGHESFV